MKRIAWMPAGILGLSFLVARGAAQELPTVKVLPPTTQMHSVSTSEAAGHLGHPHFRPRWNFPSLGAPVGPCPTPSPTPSVTDPTTPPTPTSPTTPTSPEDALSGAGQFKNSPGNLSSVFAGAGTGAATSGDPISTAIITPLIIPGLFTAGSAQSALPMDRVFFDYGYFPRVGVYGVGTSAPQLNRQTITQTTVIPSPLPPSIPPTIITTTRTDFSVSQSSAIVAGFNLNTFNFGVEKTFLDGRGSVYVGVPLLYTTDNITGQEIDGLGDVSAGFKWILSQNPNNGNTLTAGLTVSFPSAHPALSRSVTQTGNGTGDALVPSTDVSINPTFFQPWAAGLVVFGNLFFHEYFAVIVPTDDRVSTFINNDFTVGYALYRAGPERLLTSVTPNMSLHMLIPVNHVGTPPDPGTVTFVPFQGDGALPPPVGPDSFLFSTQAFLTAGIQVGMRQTISVSANVIVPVAGPRGYPIGGTFSLNYFY